MLVVAFLTCLSTSCLSQVMATCLLSCDDLFMWIHFYLVSLGIMVCIIP
jgi:hypothetical protein